MDVLHYTIEELRKLKLATEGAAGLGAIESAFHFKLPSDAAQIGAVLGRGVIKDYESFDPARVIEETERLRASGGSKTKVVIGKLEGHLVAYEFGLAQPQIQVADTEELAAFTYAGLILEQIERINYREVRAALERDHPDLTSKAAQKWQHRWSRDELATIDAELERGRQIPDGLPMDEEASNNSLRDLRGIVKPSRGYWERAERRTTRSRFDRIDFSFCDWFFDLVEACDCLFRGAMIGAMDSRFERCDFTMIDSTARSQFLQNQLNGEFIDCDFTGASLAECTLKGQFTRCNFTAADMWWAQHDGATFTDCTFSQNRFGGDARHWDEMRKAW